MSFRAQTTILCRRRFAARKLLAIARRIRAMSFSRNPVKIHRKADAQLRQFVDGIAEQIERKADKLCRVQGESL